MKYSLQIPKQFLCLFLIASCLGQRSYKGDKISYKYELFPETPELLDIYISEEDKSYSLVMEFSAANFDYVTNETFAPPSLNLLLKNVEWKKGNFTKKTDKNPLYNYSVSIPRNDNQKEIKERLAIKMDFTRVPEYKIKLVPAKKKIKIHKLKVTWEKT